MQTMVDRRAVNGGGDASLCLDFRDYWAPLRIRSGGLDRANWHGETHDSDAKCAYYYCRTNR